MEQPKYKLRVKSGVEPPEEWSRMLVSFAGFGGIRLVKEFEMECIVEAGPITIGRIRQFLNDEIDIFDYVEGEHTDLDDVKEMDDAYNWWKG